MKESGATSAAREAALLRAILTTAVTDGILTRNPVDSKLCRSSSRLAHRPPTLKELETLVEVMEKSAEKLKLAVLLAAFGGLRLSEWRALRRRDLVIEGDRVIVNITRQAQHISGSGWSVGPPKSTEGARAVKLPSFLTAAVRHHLSEFKVSFPDSLLFELKGQSAFLHDAQFNLHWNRARQAAGVRVKEGDSWVNIVRAHDLRHFHLSLYGQSGATLAELKARGGHSTTQASMVYQHALVDREAELVDAMPTLRAALPPMERIGQR
jgi:integrase